MTLLWVTLLLTLTTPSLALTADEIASFKPRLPDHVERNTGLKAHYSLVDNRDGTLTFKGNDIPPHDTWVFPQPHGNPHELLESNYTINIPNVPQMRKDPFRLLPLSVVGVATTGVQIFANFPDVKKCPYVPGFEELDICDGHPAPSNSYHYHYYAHCILQPVCGQASGIVGVALDGHPIYGPWGDDGIQMTAEDTDECGGKLDNEGRYKYYMTIDPPFFMDCLWGEVLKNVVKDEKVFLPTCPYDDTYLGNDHLDGPYSQFPPPPPPPQTCNFTEGTGIFAKCENKYNETYDIGMEWVRTMKTVDLAPCCPAGWDCGFSCKTDEGVKKECYIESRTIAYTEIQPRGYCSDWCTMECDGMKGDERRECIKSCMTFCLLPKGNPNFIVWPEMWPEEM